MVIWWNTTPKSYIPKNSSKGKLRIACKFRQMFQSSVNPCIMYYLMFLNFCLGQIANLATKWQFDNSNKNQPLYLCLYSFRKKKKGKEHERGVKVIVIGSFILWILFVLQWSWSWILCIIKFTSCVIRCLPALFTPPLREASLGAGEGPGLPPVQTSENQSHQGNY